MSLFILCAIRYYLGKRLGVKICGFLQTVIQNKEELNKEGQK